MVSVNSKRESRSSVEPDIGGPDIHVSLDLNSGQDRRDKTLFQIRPTAGRTSLMSVDSEKNSIFPELNLIPVGRESAISLLNCTAAPPMSKNGSWPSQKWGKGHNWNDSSNWDGGWSSYRSGSSSYRNSDKSGYKNAKQDQPPAGAESPASGANSIKAIVAHPSNPFRSEIIKHKNDSSPQSSVPEHTLEDWDEWHKRPLTWRNEAEKGIGGKRHWRDQNRDREFFATVGETDSECSNPKPDDGDDMLDFDFDSDPEEDPVTKRQITRERLLRERPIQAMRESLLTASLSVTPKALTNGGDLHKGLPGASVDSTVKVIVELEIVDKVAKINRSKRMSAFWKKVILKVRKLRRRQKELAAIAKASAPIFVNGNFVRPMDVDKEPRWDRPLEPYHEVSLMKMTNSILDLTKVWPLNTPLKRTKTSKILDGLEPLTRSADASDPPPIKGLADTWSFDEKFSVGPDQDLDIVFLRNDAKAEMIVQCKLSENARSKQAELTTILEIPTTDSVADSKGNDDVKDKNIDPELGIEENRKIMSSTSVPKQKELKDTSLILPQEPSTALTSARSSSPRPSSPMKGRKKSDDGVKEEDGTKKRSRSRSPK